MHEQLSHNLPANSRNNLPTNITNNRITTFFKNKGLSSKLGRKARQCNFVKRESSFKPMSFAQSIIASTGRNSSQVSLAKLCENYNVNYDGKMQDKPFWNRLSSDGCVEFFQNILNEIQELHNKIAKKCPYREGAKLIQALNEMGLPIDDILLCDGTYWKLKSELAEEYPGTRSNTQKQVMEGVIDENGKPCYVEVEDAGIGLQSRMSLKTGAINSIAITPETANEKSYVVVPNKDGAKALILMDSGYYNLKLLEKIDTNGSYYITKGRKNCAAVISECRTWGTYRKIDPKAEEYNGMKISDALIKLRNNKQNIDFKATYKTGQTVRMVAFYTKEKDDMVLLITNIDERILPAKLVTDTYRIRWQIELAFKNLKSGNSLKFSNRTANKNILLVLILASFCAYFLKNITANFLSQQLENISLWKIHVGASWFEKFTKAFFKGNIEKMHEILKTLKDRSTFVTKSRQSTRKHAEGRTFASVLNNIVQSIVAPITIDDLLVC